MRLYVTEWGGKGVDVFGTILCWFAGLLSVAIVGILIAVILAKPAPQECRAVKVATIGACAANGWCGIVSVDGLQATARLPVVGGLSEICWAVKK